MNDVMMTTTIVIHIHSMGLVRVYLYLDHKPFQPHVETPGHGCTPRQQGQLPQEQILRHGTHRRTRGFCRSDRADGGEGNQFLPGQLSVDRMFEMMMIIIGWCDRYLRRRSGWCSKKDSSSFGTRSRLPSVDRVSSWRSNLWRGRKRLVGWLINGYKLRHY